MGGGFPLLRAEQDHTPVRGASASGQVQELLAHSAETETRKAEAGNEAAAQTLLAKGGTALAWEPVLQLLSG